MNQEKPVITMGDKYGDGSTHLVCQKCGNCIDCGDCYKFGCHEEVRYKKSTEETK